jgi:hypothetical protein
VAKKENQMLGKNVKNFQLKISQQQQFGDRKMSATVNLAIPGQWGGF